VKPAPATAFHRRRTPATSSIDLVSALKLGVGPRRAAGSSSDGSSFRTPWTRRDREQRGRIEGAGLGPGLVGLDVEDLPAEAHRLAELAEEAAILAADRLPDLSVHMLLGRLPRRRSRRARARSE
jgi:hypothetical protein